MNFEILGDSSNAQKSEKSNRIESKDSDQLNTFEIIRDQLAYHTAESKSNCEKRDLNNISCISNDTETSDYSKKTQIYLNPKMLYEDHHLPSMSQDDQQYPKNLKKDLASPQKELPWRLPNFTNTTSKSDNRDKSMLFTTLCNINLSTIVSWICCIVCLFCVYTTTNLRFHFKVTS